MGTLTLGILHLSMTIFYARVRPVLISSFVVYILFRQISFPLFFGSITSKLGFKYFGLLQGIGFGLAGLSQTFIAPLVSFVSGTCHKYEMSRPCDHGMWNELHSIQMII